MRCKNIIHKVLNTKCVNKIDKSGKFDIKTCKSKLDNLRRICTFKRNIKPPFKKGWEKHYILCNTNILNQSKSKDTIDKMGKTLKRVCNTKINNLNKICTYKHNINPSFEIGPNKKLVLCRTQILKKGKPLHFPTKLKCKKIKDKSGKINLLCKKKTDTIMRICKFTYKKKQFGKPKIKCTNTNKRKSHKSRTRKSLRGGTVNPFPDIGSMFGTLGNSIQSMVNTIYVPPTAAYNPSLPISLNPSSQFLTNTLTQPITTIYKSL